MVDVALCLNAMYCFANICYVCLEKKSKLISNINSSLSVNTDIIHIIGHLPFNLGWLKTLQIILICEECCLRLRRTYQFLEKCSKNSALLQVYRDNLNTTPISTTGNGAELLVKLNNIQENMNEVKCEIQSEDEEMYTFQWQPNIEKIDDVFVDFEDSLIKEAITCKNELDDKQDYNSTGIIEDTEDVFVNLEDYFVKEENTWKREEVDDTEEYPTDNNSTESMNIESDSEISVSDNAGKKSFNCSTCSKSITAKSASNIHTRIYSGEKPYECAMCKTRHMRSHTGEYSCSRCKKCFTYHSNLVRHVRVHIGEKPYSCSKCKKCFTHRSNLVCHMRIHTGEKPYSCTMCKKCFAQHSNLVRHMRLHTGEKPYSCSRCKKCFTQHSNLVRHMRIHTGEKP